MAKARQMLVDAVLRAGRRAARRAGERVARGAEAAGRPVRVVFEGEGEGSAPAGATLLATAQRLGVEIDHFCGGQCSCGTCRVQVLEGAGALSAMASREQLVLGDAAARLGQRLACQARVRGPVVVRVPRWG